MINDKKITRYHCIRNATGALIDMKAPVMLQFKKNQKLRQGFTIHNQHCSLCRQSRDREGCAHMAALAILSLTMPADQAKAMPIPLGFADSGWLKIGMFLHEWLSRTQASLQTAAAEACSLWEITAGDGLVRTGIPESWDVPGKMLLPLTVKRPKITDPDEAFTLLDDQLQILTMSKAERLLAESGNNSIGRQRDSSFWIWLTRMLYIFHQDTIPLLEKKDSSFSLRIGAEGKAGSLTITLPRQKTWEAVRTMPSSPETPILPAAKECFRVFFNDDNLLEIHPCLRLDDGRILSREDLASNRFSNSYYLEDEGFLPTISLPAEGIFTNPSTQAETMPLLGYLQNEKGKNHSFTVPLNKIADFVKANRKPLSFPDNIVAADLRDLQIQELPDQLYIDSFEEHEDWCYLSCRYGLGNTSISLRDIAGAREKKLTSLHGGKWLQLENTPLSWLYDLLGERTCSGDSGRIRLSYREMLALTSLIPEVNVTIKEKSRRQQLNDLLDPSSWTDDNSLSDAPVHLRSYQRNGLAWLNHLYRLGIGGLLADDMGLGKTHQGLALLQGATQNDGTKLMLVICPASVVLNWAEKIDFFYPDLNYAVYHGNQRDLHTALTHGLILTTYGIARQELELLRQFCFDIILLDEIQHLKNRSTGTHRAIAALDGRVKIGLTGTPVENSLQDLRSLFDICLPGLLGSERNFERLYVKPITENGNNEVRDRLSRLVHPFILRRSRSQVLRELPETIEDDRICELSDDQVSLYREVIENREMAPGGWQEDIAATPYMNILAAITRLKQICCHPCLIQGCDDPNQYQSGKWDLFVELTEELLSADMKCVIFSQYTGMISMIENHLRESGVGYAGLKGNMPIDTRQKMITEFNTNPDCRFFCASLLAGGTGIDLTGAQAVIHYDRWWNPAREEQATARVHRMGQKNVVQVFRLITRGTLEEKIHKLIAKKRALATSLIQEDEAGIIKQLDREQLAELFQFTPSSG